MPERVDRRAHVGRARPSSRTSRGARSRRRAPRRRARSSRPPRPSRSASIANSSSATNRKSTWSTSATTVTARSCPISGDLAGQSRIDAVAEAVVRDRRRPDRVSSSSGSAPDVLAVQPVELLVVEERGGVRHAVEVELGDQLLARQHLAPVGRRPTEQREVVDQRVGEVAPVAEVLDRDRAVPLRELAPGRRRRAAGGARTAIGSRRIRARRAARARGASSRGGPRPGSRA